MTSRFRLVARPFNDDNNNNSRDVFERGTSQGHGRVIVRRHGSASVHEHAPGDLIRESSTDVLRRRRVGIFFFFFFFCARRQITRANAAVFVAPGARRKPECIGILYTWYYLKKKKIYDRTRILWVILFKTI